MPLRLDFCLDVLVVVHNRNGFDPAQLDVHVRVHALGRGLRASDHLLTLTLLDSHQFEKFGVLFLFARKLCLENLLDPSRGSSKNHPLKLSLLLQLFLGQLLLPLLLTEHLFLVELSELLALGFLPASFVRVEFIRQLALLDLDPPEEVFVVDGFGNVVEKCVFKGAHKLLLFDFDRACDAVHAGDVFAGQVVGQAAQHTVERLLAHHAHKRVVLFALLAPRAALGFLTAARGGAHRRFAQGRFFYHFAHDFLGVYVENLRLVGVRRRLGRRFERRLQRW